MKKRSMVVDLHKLARKYPSEVRALFDAMDTDKTLAKVRRLVSAENGNLDARGRIKRPTFDGVPGMPAWKVARRLGWKTCLVSTYAHIYELRSKPYCDGTKYFDPADVERVAKLEEQKVLDLESSTSEQSLRASGSSGARTSFRSRCG